MSKFENIEQRFKETFDRFEADVNPSVWSGVQKNISSSNPVSSSGKISLGKVVGSIGLIFIGIAGAGLWHWYFDQKSLNVSTNTPPAAVTTAPPNTVAEQVQNNYSIVAEQYLSPSIQEENTTNTIQKPNDNSTPTENTKQGEVKISVEEPASVSAAQENKVVEQVQVSEPAANMPGFNGLMRGNKPYNAASQNAENYSAPVAKIFSNTGSGEAPLTVEFLNKGNAYSLNWSFGDGATSKENTPSHTFTKAGVYVVLLTAKTSLGSATDKVTIEVKTTSGILNAPNIFTPNGDGENDLFFLELKNIASIGVVVFSREQGVVYDWNTIDGGWNGKLKTGLDAPEGTYFYTVQATGTDGTTHSKKGSIFLTRH